MARLKVFALVPVQVELSGGTVGSLTPPHTGEAQAALGRFQRFKGKLDTHLESIVQSAGVLKGDDVVDDGACDAIVTCCRKIATAWNEYLKASGMAVKDYRLNPPGDLDPSPYEA